MMEPISLGIGVASITGAFTGAIDCFHHVQVALHAHEDLHNLTLELDMTQLRLSRWGKAFGLGSFESDYDFAELIKGRGFKDHDVQVAVGTLAQLTKTFEDAKTMMSKMVPPSQTSPEAVLDTNTQVAHLALTQISRKRIPSKMKLVDRTKWSLWRKENLESLITTVDKHVKNVIELLPPPQHETQTACQEEVVEMKRLNQAVLERLGSIAKEKDEDLKAAMDAQKQSAISATTVTSTSTNTFGTNEGGQQIGHFQGHQQNTFGGVKK